MMAWEEFEWLGWLGMSGDKAYDVWGTHLKALRRNPDGLPDPVWANTADLMATVVVETRRMATKRLFVPAHAGTLEIATSQPGSWSLPLADPVLRAINDMHSVFAVRYARRPFLVELLKPLVAVLGATPGRYLTDPAALADTTVRLPSPSEHDRTLYDASFYEAAEGERRADEHGIDRHPLTIKDHRDDTVAIDATYTEVDDTLHVRCGTLRAGLALEHAGQLVRIAFLDVYADGWYRGRINHIQIEEATTNKTLRVPYPA